MNIFTIYHAASTVGSIISKIIDAMKNSITFSEINPYVLFKRSYILSK